MALTYEKGTLTFMSEIKSGTSKATGNPWSIQTIVLDVPGFQGSFRKLALKVSGRDIELLADFKVGDQVEVGYQVSSREYNGNWYNDVNLQKIGRIGDRKAAQAEPASAFDPKANLNEQPEDLPFA